MSLHPERLVRKVLVTMDRICSRREDPKPSLLELSSKVRAPRRAAPPASCRAPPCRREAPATVAPVASTHLQPVTLLPPPLSKTAPLSQAYGAFREALVRYEREMLKAFGFITHVHHPHKQMLNYCQVIRVEQADPALMQEAWNIVNDR